MSEKLCLQWNDFKENVNSAFGKLRNDKEFSNVTLACEDGQEIEAHKVILAASSPFLRKFTISLMPFRPLGKSGRPIFDIFAKYNLLKYLFCIGLYKAPT